jgi:predicted  nucleic acid-binding Zn-ribbon protein
MKGLIAVVAIAIAALLAYNYVHTGRLALIPSSVSQDEQALQHIEERFETARRRFEAAGRAAGVAGVDTTADAEAARRDIDKAEADLADLRTHLGGALQAKAEQLRTEIEAFRNEMR